MKKIDTLVQDILSVVSGKGGWTKAINDFFKEEIGESSMKHFSSPSLKRKETLRMSNVGKPCTRQLWYSLKEKEDPEGEATYSLKYFMGEYLETLLIHLAIASGHKVELRQKEVNFNGIKGHIDCLIDGCLVDIKSASSFSFKKFTTNSLRSDDPFGYIKQQTGYLCGLKDYKELKDKTTAYFLVIDKSTGDLCLDSYNLTDDMKHFKGLTDKIKKSLGEEEPPERAFYDEEFQKGGNRKLGYDCSWCLHKFTCWPSLRAFKYSNGSVIYLTEVNKEPKIEELI